jgi:hypothetical protein
MDWNIMKGICWMSPEMGSTLKIITLEPSNIGHDLLYTSVS